MSNEYEGGRLFDPIKSSTFSQQLPWRWTVSDFLVTGEISLIFITSYHAYALSSALPPKSVKAITYLELEARKERIKNKKPLTNVRSQLHH